VGEGTVQIRQESLSSNPSRRRLTLTPSPSQGWIFVEWSGDLIGSAIPKQIVLVDEKIVTVNFRLLVPPTITTGLISNVTTNSATVAGNVTADGGFSVNSRGICYATTPIPTLDNTCINSGSGTGGFAINITGLSDNTRYYVRAYATNLAGTGYGDQTEFTTLLSPSRDTQTAVVDVLNPVTGRTWMDRNLGASRAATSSTDTQAYGDLYQWGRGADGHEKRNSSTTTTLSDSDTPNHGNFILAPNVPTDWRSPHNNNLWQGLNGVNNPCPVGYRIPTDVEWDNERLSWSSNNALGAFESPLKLTTAGYRNFASGNFVASSGHYWSSTVASQYARFLYISNNPPPTIAGGIAAFSRADGLSVRCIKH
jgi:uncharacterized protein (TIGR02145 family)